MIGYRHFWLYSNVLWLTLWPSCEKIFWWNPLPAGNFFYENTVIKSYLATSRIIKSNLATSLRKYFIKWADNILTIADQSGKLSKCSNVEDFTFKLWVAPPSWFPRKALSWFRIYLFIHMFWVKEGKFVLNVNFVLYFTFSWTLSIGQHKLQTYVHFDGTRI